MLPLVVAVAEVESDAELAEAGVKRISVGSAFFRVAYGAFIKAAREITDSGTFERTQHGIGFAEIETFFPEDTS